MTVVGRRPSPAYRNLRREFFPAEVAPSVVRAIETMLQRRRAVREAHLVAIRESRSTRVSVTLVLVVDDPAITTTLAGDLRRVLQSHARPGIVVLAEGDDELVRVRGLGGELKRSTKPFPWWLLLFIG